MVNLRWVKVLFGFVSLISFIACSQTAPLIFPTYLSPNVRFLLEFDQERILVTPGSSHTVVAIISTVSSPPTPPKVEITVRAKRLSLPTGEIDFNPASVTIPAGSKNGTFQIQVNPKARPGTYNVEFIASEKGDSKVALATLTITVTAPYLREQFGTDLDDRTEGIAVDSEGNIYTVGSTKGVFPDQTNYGSYDAFLRKYARDGSVETWQFGSSSSDSATDLAIDSQGNIYIVGWTRGVMGAAAFGQLDAFVRKYARDGSVRTWQFGSTENDTPTGIAIDSKDNVYIVGDTDGSVGGKTHAGLGDAFIHQYTAAGTDGWTDEFGTRGTDLAHGIAIDTKDNIFVVGETNGNLASHLGSVDAFIRRYDASSGRIDTKQFGTTGGDIATAIAISAGGNCYVVGKTDSRLGAKHFGGTDGFLHEFSNDLKAGFITQFGTTESDLPIAIDLDTEGNAYVVGGTGTFVSDYNGFTRQFQADGTPTWYRELGTPEMDTVTDIVEYRGSVYVSGWTLDLLPGQTSIGAPDGFIWSYATDGSP